MAANRLFFPVTFFILRCTIHRASGEFLSSGVSHAICESQLEFVETGKIGEALKDRPKDVPSECKWYQRNGKSTSECKSIGNCSYFVEKSCAQLGISDSSNSYEDPKEGSRLGSRIVGGREISPPFKYPSFVYINESLLDLGQKFQRADADLNKKFFCGAVIINEQWLLTAAHCVANFGKYFVFGAMAGRHNRSEADPTEQYSKIVKAIVHPNYAQNESQGKEITKKVDLALLKLETPLKFNEKIAPAQLPTKVYDIGDFTLVGIGVYLAFENTTEIDPEAPQEVDLPAITIARCREIADEVNTDPDKIPDHAICFYREPDSGASVCNSDSGSPVYKIEEGKQVLVGIAWATTNGVCGKKGLVSMYMQVYPFLKWIQDNTSKSGRKATQISNQTNRKND